MTRDGRIRYHADTAPDPEGWLASSEAERDEAVSRFHRLKGAPTGESPEAHVSLHVVVENQLALDDPPEARIATERLQSEGLGRHEAIHAIASVLSALMAGALRGEPFDGAAYRSRLENLSAALWNDGFAYLPKGAASLASRFVHAKDRRRADAAIHGAPDADAVPARVAIAERGDLDGADGEEPYSFRAIELLGERRTPKAVAELLTMLPVFESTEDMRFDRVIFALQASGAAALELHAALRPLEEEPLPRRSGAWQIR